MQAHLDLPVAQTFGRVALSDAVGEMSFVVDDASGATGSLVDQHGTFHGYNLHDSYGLQKKIFVPTRRLDDYQPLFEGRRLLVKIDVEGAEHLVFAGAMEVMRKFRPVFFCECFELHKLSAVVRQGYRVFSLGEDGNHVCLPEEASLAERLRPFADITAAVAAAKASPI